MKFVDLVSGSLLMFVEVRDDLVFLSLMFVKV